ncbi:septal ring lytic transglycosylase RlpA family protein [[Haemophilus] felis]|nr:septal ring lytic transglycosylase RlpA family protein [[Haemophilus] felis]
MTNKYLVKFILLLLACCCQTSIQAKTDTVELFGVKGHKLEHKKVSTKAHFYVVKGKTYQTKVRDDIKNYTKEGIASYYHKKFHGRKTASGEIYNEKLYTAAHKTLPLNSYVLVTNLRNQKKVIVRINDRGPFVKNRIIDLSKAAATEIGMIGRGLFPVRLEALHVNHEGKILGAANNTLVELAQNDLALQKLNKESVDSESKIAAPQLVPETKYKIKLLGFTSQKSANNFVKKLALENMVFEVAQDNKKYSIYFGPLATKEESDNLKAKLKKLTPSKILIVYEYN